MPANVYESKREVYVSPFSGATIKYGFLTNVREAVGSECGHTAVNRANPPTALVFGANAPKPGRATKQDLERTDSTYFDYARYSTLKSLGYSTVLGSIRRGSPTALTRSVYVTIDGVKYAWRMRNDSYAKIGGDRAALGIIDATSADRDLVWGASYPKPPVVRARIVGQGGIDVLSTFCDPSRIDNLPDGWSSSARERVI